MLPLNPKLYAALKREFGSVRISNQGVPIERCLCSGR